MAACVRDCHPDVFLSVSVTTRAPRPGEVDGLHYHFIDDSQFDQLIADDGLLEWAVVHQTARYGTPRRPVEEALAEGRPVLLEVDPQGARQVRMALPEATLVFLSPPSWEELLRRLTGRGTEDDAERRRRLRTAESDLAAQPEFDATIVNRDVRTACEQLVALMRSPTRSCEA